MSANEIPAPGNGALEGAADNPATQSTGTDGRPANTCATCKWAMPLSPGHAIICGEKWRHLEWNDAVPLTHAEKSCDKHEARANENTGVR